MKRNARGIKPCGEIKRSANSDHAVGRHHLGVHRALRACERRETARVLLLGQKAYCFLINRELPRSLHLQLCLSDRFTRLLKERHPKGVQLSTMINTSDSGQNVNMNCLQTASSANAYKAVTDARIPETGPFVAGCRLRPLCGDSGVFFGFHRSSSHSGTVPSRAAS